MLLWLSAKKIFLPFVFVAEFAYHGLMQSLFKFPNPVNEHSARFVAAGVVCMSLGVSIFGQIWLLVPLTYGFLARVLTGPTLSPLGQFVTRILVPKLNWTPKYCPGPPKRFAQGIGASLSVAACIAWFSYDTTTPARIIVAMILFASTLESVFGFCMGCWIFSYLMKFKIIPEHICDACVIPQR